MHPICGKTSHNRFPGAPGPGGLAARTVLGEICVEQMIGDGDGNGLLAAEIAVDGHRRQIGVLGDLGDGGLVNALGEEAPLVPPE